MQDGKQLHSPVNPDFSAILVHSMSRNPQIVAPISPKKSLKIIFSKKKPLIQTWHEEQGTATCSHCKICKAFPLAIGLGIDFKKFQLIFVFIKAFASGEKVN